MNDSRKSLIHKEKTRRNWYSVLICSESSGNEIGREARGAQKKGRLAPTFAALEGSISNNSRKRGAEKGALPVKSSAWTEGY